MILTTHSMEEADVLCTTIGIMSNGWYLLTFSFSMMVIRADQSVREFTFDVACAAWGRSKI